MFMSTASTRWLARRPPSPRYTHFAAKSSPPMRKPAHSLGRCTTQIVTFKEGGPLLPSSFASSEASGVNPIIGRCRALLYPERNRRDEPFKPFFSAFCFLLSAFCFLLLSFCFHQVPVHPLQNQLSHFRQLHVRAVKQFNVTVRFLSVFA